MSRFGLRINRSSFASLFAVIIITADVLFPFVMMSILQLHTKRITSKKFASKYGAVVEGIDIYCDDAYKAHYYAVFASQRFILAVVLVVLFRNPDAQCYIMLVVHLVMMIYIGWMKPFDTF